jgi:hypothetical protein
VTESSGPTRKGRVARGEGEVTQWPRGLVDYVPKDTPETPPSLEEDRTRNRLLLAARLLSLLRSRGENVDREVVDLARAERAFAEGDRRRATELVERLLGELDRRAPIDRSRSSGERRSAARASDREP